VPQRWSDMFDRALERAATLRTIGQVHEPASDVGWEYIMEVTAGLALHTARVARLDVQPMALWDGRPGRAAGGTANFVEFWTHQLNQPPVIISLPPSDTPYKDIKPQRIERPTLHQQVKSMLFADIVGYSKLTEQVIPEFIGVFMERVSQLAASSKHAPRSINTWGDAVYAIFDFAHDAGCFAQELTQMIHEGRNDWLAKGLYWEEPANETGETVKHPLTIRVGLHTGPVFMHYDPIVRRLGFTGEHVNRAARIEPVAKHGEVFASEEFAALAELGAEIRKRDTGGGDAEGDGFVCEYAGSMELAKGYPGRFRIYRVLAKRTFAIEELAMTAHQSYCDEARARGETAATNPAIRPWAELPDDLRDANRAQVADIPNKLRLLGYELAPSWGLRASEIKMTDAQIEELSIREHDRWMNDRIRHGWTFAPVRDNGRKHHPLLVPWEDLSEPEKEKDRDAVRNMRRLIDKAGFRVRKTQA
jgi:class 3 adenylate cyclase